MTRRFRHTERAEGSVTTVIPSQGRDRGLPEAISSVRHQEGVRSRIIVVFDGGPTSAGDRQAAEALEPPDRVIYLRSLNSPAMARNMGLALVETPFTAFLDDDDAWKVHKLRVQLHALDLEPSAVLCCSNASKTCASDMAAGPDYFPEMPRSLSVTELLKTNWVITSSALVRTECMRTVGGFPMHLQAEDYGAWLRVITNGPGVVCAEPLLKYSVGSTLSASGSHDDAVRLEVLKDFSGWLRSSDRRLRPKDRRLLQALFQIELDKSHAR